MKHEMGPLDQVSQMIFMVICNIPECERVPL
jgi:hypothetical protein